MTNVIACLAVVSFAVMQGAASNVDLGVLTCPESHPFAYYQGSYCCAHGKEKVFYENGIWCDGSTINWNSLCCYEDYHIECPHGKGQCWDNWRPLTTTTTTTTTISTTNTTSTYKTVIGTSIREFMNVSRTGRFDSQTVDTTEHTIMSHPTLWLVPFLSIAVLMLLLGGCIGGLSVYLLPVLMAAICRQRAKKDSSVESLSLDYMPFRRASSSGNMNTTTASTTSLCMTKSPSIPECLEEKGTEVENIYESVVHPVADPEEPERIHVIGVEVETVSSSKEASNELMQQIISPCH